MSTDVYELKIWWSDADGKKSCNVLHYQDPTVTGASGPYAIAQNLIDAFVTDCQSELLACVASDVTLTVYQCRRVNNGGGPTCEEIKNVAGAHSGVSVTNANAANLTFIPASAPYQRKEGHFYLGGVPAGAIVGDKWQTAFEVLVGQFLTDLQAGLIMGLETFTQVIFDRTTAVPTQISNWLFRNVITPIRRRLKPRY
jgi:hypothetical protein